jgi:hypothetical protein
MCGVRFGTVAVLLPVPFRAGGALATVVRAMRRAGVAPRHLVPGLPARRDRDRARAVRVRRADPSLDPPVEVRGVARRRRCAGGRDDRGVGRRPVDAESRHVGAAVPRAARRARLRPGPGAGVGGRSQAGRTGRPARPPPRGTRDRRLAAGRPRGARRCAGCSRLRVPRAGSCSSTTCSPRAPPGERAPPRCSRPGPRWWGCSRRPGPCPRRGGPGLYSATGSRPGLWLPRGTDPRQSMPAAGEATHVSRPLVGEHGAV